MRIAKKILRWADTYTASIAAVGFGVFFFFCQVGSPGLKTSDNILHLEGKVINYAFKLKPGYGATLKQYYIWLDKYPCAFLINADFLSYFYKAKFEKEVKAGDMLKLTIPKDLGNQIWDKHNKVFILSASKNSSNFLSLDKTIPKKNDNFNLYAGSFFVTMGIAYYILRKYKIISR